jgi:hypothetical protein
MENAAIAGNFDVISSRREELERLFELFRIIAKEMNHENTDSRG